MGEAASLELPSFLKRPPGCTIWLTGLSGSGKSTLAGALAARLAELEVETHILDGDTMRRELCCDLGFSKQDRDENIRRIAWVARLLNDHGIISIVAAISPYREARDRARNVIPRFLEVFVDCPMHVLVKRDTKGLYKEALAGSVTQFSGISDPYEPPLHPEVHLNSSDQSLSECKEAVLTALEQKGWISSNGLIVPDIVDRQTIEA